MVNDPLGDRMKEYYENVPKIKMTRRTPVAIRLDGKAFHTFTKGFQRPFDDILIKTMQETAKRLCEKIQGAVIAYTQSDEITIIIQDYANLNTSAWFDYSVEKICSIAASMATLCFNNTFRANVLEVISHLPSDSGYAGALSRALTNGALFDARCFNIPEQEVTNLLYWRQSDAIRNSIQMVGQANFSHKQLQSKKCLDIKTLLSDKGIYWDDFPIYKQRGSCVIKKVLPNGNGVERAKWVIDKEIPIFVGEGRDYVESILRGIREEHE